MKNLLATVLLLLGVSSPQHAFAIERGPSLTPDEINGAITEIASDIAEYYLLEDTGQKMEDFLAARYQDGAYDGMDPWTFSEQVTRDMQSVSNDWHMYVSYLPPPDPTSKKEAEKKDQTPSPSRPSFAILQNYGFGGFSWLPGRIAVIKLNVFFPLAQTKPLIDAAFNLAENATAIVFDLRSNIGGNPDLIRYIQGHFLDKPVHLLTFKERFSGRTWDEVTNGDVADDRFLKTPVYIVTSHICASACEDFAFTSKEAGMATIVGETTAGAAFMVKHFTVIDKFQLSVSVAGPFSAFSGKNWEGVGVTPDYAVDAPNALDFAVKLILQKQLAAETDSFTRDGLQFLIETLDARMSQDPAKAAALEEYSGQYESYQVSVAGNYLKLVEGSRLLFYKEISPDIFELVAEKPVRLEFTREDGKITGFTLKSQNAPSKNLTRTN